MQEYNEQQPYTVPSTYGSASDAPTYTGNKQDNTATLAMVVGATLVISSCTFGLGGCLLPIFAFVGGIIGLRGANGAIDPGRTRTYAWIGIATGGVILALIIGVVLLYGGLIFAALSSGEFAP
jgi:hypothetical protein